MEANFKKASEYVRHKEFAKILPQSKKPQLYGLFKQATEGSGPPNGRPGMMEVEKRAKHDAWATCSSLTKVEAQMRYVALVSSIDPNFAA